MAKKKLSRGLRQQLARREELGAASVALRSPLTDTERARLRGAIRERQWAAREAVPPEDVASDALLLAALADAGLAGRVSVRDLRDVLDEVAQEWRKLVAVSEALTEAGRRHAAADLPALAVALGVPLGPELLAAVGVEGDLPVLWGGIARDAGLA